MSITTIQIRRGTASAWTAVNPVLADGEIGYETDAFKLKIGDGATHWATLPYVVGDVGSAIDVIDNLTTNDGTKALSAAQGVVLLAQVASKPTLQSGALASSTTQAPNASAVITAIASGAAAVVQTGVLATGAAVAPNATAVINAISAAQAAAVSTVLGGAGPAFDTLQELANALADDANFATTMTTALAGKVPTTRTINTQPLSTDIVLVKGDVGLGNVDNTADAIKPISSATQSALDQKVDLIAPNSVVAGNVTMTSAHLDRLNEWSDVSDGTASVPTSGMGQGDYTAWLNSSASNTLSFSGLASVASGYKASIGPREIGVLQYKSGSWYSAIPSGSGAASAVATITGSLGIGATLTCTLTTGWSGTFQWTKDGTNIAGATNQTYTILSADAGHTLTCKFTPTLFTPGGVVAIDNVAPTLISATVANATPTHIDLVWSEPMNSTISAFSAFAVSSGHTLTAHTYVDSTHSYLTTSTAFVASETKTLAYTQPASNKMQDLAGNLLANITSASITDNVIPPAGSIVINSATAPTAENMTTGNGGSAYTDWLLYGSFPNQSSDYKKTSGGSTISVATAGGATRNNPGTASPVDFTSTSDSTKISSSTTNQSATESSVGAGYAVTGTGSQVIVSLPASTTPRTAKIVLGYNAASATGTANVLFHLSDGSATDVNQTLTDNATGTAWVEYNFTYNAGSAGQTLTVTLSPLTAAGGVASTTICFQAAFYV